MNTLIDLTGKHVLVIGASSGIGRQTAITLSRIGAKLTLVARTEDKLKTALQELEGEGHAYYVTDISELSGIEEMVKQTIQKNGCLDGMVYAAGISMSMPLQMFKPQKLQSLFDVNFFAFVLLFVRLWGANFIFLMIVTFNVVFFHYLCAHYLIS